jgi:hypothetical protein
MGRIAHGNDNFKSINHGLKCLLTGSNKKPVCKVDLPPPKANLPTNDKLHRRLMKSSTLMMRRGCAGGEEAEVKEDKAPVVVG